MNGLFTLAVIVLSACAVVYGVFYFGMIIIGWIIFRKTMKKEKHNARK